MKIILVNVLFTCWTDLKSRHPNVKSDISVISLFTKKGKSYVVVKEEIHIQLSGKRILHVKT